MLAFLWQATRGYRFTPWRSPYLRWRMETYWGTPAASITFAAFWHLIWERRQDMLRLLGWVRENR